MKKFCIVLVVLLFTTLQTYSQGDPWDCDPDVTDPADDDYCIPIPIDENVILLVLGGVGFGLWKIRKNSQFNLSYLKDN